MATSPRLEAAAIAVMGISDRTRRFSSSVRIVGHPPATPAPLLGSPFWRNNAQKAFLIRPKGEIIEEQAFTVLKLEGHARTSIGPMRPEPPNLA